MAIVGNWARALVLVFLDRLGDLQHLGAKHAQISGILNGRRDAMIIAVSTDARNVDDARGLLTEFISSNYESVQVVNCNRTVELDGAR